METEDRCTREHRGQSQREHEVGELTGLSADDRQEHRQEVQSLTEEGPAHGAHAGKDPAESAGSSVPGGAQFSTSARSCVFSRMSSARWAADWTGADSEDAGASAVSPVVTAGVVWLVAP